MTIAWGLLSTAWINDRVIAAAEGTAAARIVAVASRDGARAAAYARKRSIATAYGSYEDLLADPAVDAVYVSLPNHLHVEWTMAALRAGKHVLCEKPLSANLSDARAVVRAARESGRCVEEGFMWRHHAQTLSVEELIAEGAIGRPAGASARFGFDLIAEHPERTGGSAGTTRWQEDSRMRPEMEGGALMDVGCYCVDAIRRFAGEPRAITADAEFGETGVDVTTRCLLEHEDGETSRLECGIVMPRCEELTIRGGEGTIEVSSPFLGSGPGITVRSKSGATREMPIATEDPYRRELEDFEAAVRDGAARDHGAIPRQAAALEAARRSLAQGERVEVPR